MTWTMTKSRLSDDPNRATMPEFAALDQAWENLIGDIMNDMSEAHDGDREVIEGYRDRIEAAVEAVVLVYHR